MASPGSAAETIPLDRSFRPPPVDRQRSNASRAGDAFRDELMGVVSHELRTPLTVVIGALRTALSEEDRLTVEDRRQLLEDAAQEAESMSHLLSNLMSLAKCDSDEISLQSEDLNLKRVVGKVLDDLRDQSSSRRFRMALGRQAPAVRADEMMLGRILFNLLDNAIKYSPNGTDIEIRAKQVDGHVFIGINNEGDGISDEYREKVFEPFHRLNGRGDPTTKGNGLGLLVCRRLVEAHGGRIWVDSAPDKGTTFWFTLPAALDETRRRTRR